MEAFTDLGIVVSGDTFCNDIIKEVELQVNLWKVPFLQGV
jgi:hypothetical protein